jgi:hypothetical protein
MYLLVIVQTNKRSTVQDIEMKNSCKILCYFQILICQIAVLKMRYTLPLWKTENSNSDCIEQFSSDFISLIFKYASVSESERQNYGSI